MSNSVTVKICGEEFKLITEDSVEYTQAVGNHVNAEMQKMLAKRVGRMDAAIMAAVNITDDLFKVRLTDEQLRAQIKSALDAEATAKADANAYKRENLSLQKRLEKAEKALAKAEKSLQKIQKTAKSGRSNGDADMDEIPAPLTESEMAEIVEKSKRPRKTRKAKAEVIQVETSEEIDAAAPVETQAAEAAPAEPQADAVPAESQADAAAPVAEAEAVEAVAEAPETEKAEAVETA